MIGIQSILSHHICSEKANWKMHMAFLLGATMCIFPVEINYIIFSRLAGYTFQIFEPYVLVMSSSHQYVALVLGLFLLISDAPFINNRTAYEILRVGKKSWFTERAIYINVLCGSYFLVMFIVCVVMAILKGNVYFDNEWSLTMHLLADRQPVFATSEFKLFFPFPQLVSELTPCCAAIYSFILTFLYGAVLSMMVLCFNSISRKRIGIIVSLGIHIAGYIITANGPMYFPQQLSMLSCAMLAYYFNPLYKINIFVTIFTFLSAWSAMWYYIRWNSKKTEF